MLSNFLDKVRGEQHTRQSTAALAAIVGWAGHATISKNDHASKGNPNWPRSSASVEWASVNLS